MRAAVIVLVLALAGCASKGITWDKSGATEQDFQADQGQCQAQAFGVPLATAMQQFAVFASCMRGKGWQGRQS